jgi:hypothetical protein
MNFLSPIPALIAAGLTVPLLVLLYFLKLKRRQLPVSSTLLWRKAIQDLQVNAPFQRIRYSILLILQLLILAAVLAAIARPVISMQSGPGQRYVLLIDRSASMNSKEGGQTRLELAKQRAKELVETMRSRMNFSLQDVSDQAMVVAFDAHAKVMCNFTSDRRQLLAAIDGIAATDGPSSLTEPVMVAKAFAQSPGDAANNRSTETPAQLELFSDGRIFDADKVLLGDKELAFHRIGSTADNVAVTAMQARRVYEKPTEVEVFATLTNFNDKPVRCDVQLSLDGNIRSVRPVDVPARHVVQADKPPVPGSVSVTFNLTHGQEGLIEVRQLRADALADDDAAWTILPAPKTLSVLLVTPGNVALESGLKACPLANLEITSPAQFEAMDAAALSANPKYDLIVLDRYIGDKVPRGRFMVFGSPPPDSGATVTGELKNQVVVDWRSRHPILQYVNFTSFFASRAKKLSLPSDATVLAEFSNGPALALVRRAGSLFLLAPFDVMDTNWPFEPGFVMFCYNATGFLGLELSQDQGGSLKVNQALSLENLPASAKVKVRGPTARDAELTVDPSGSARFADTSRVGVYELEATQRPKARFAVNLLDAQESNIEPARNLTLAGQTVKGQDQIATGNLELWPYLVLAALVLACAEWFVYNRRIHIG